MSAPGVIEAAIHAINACAELTEDERVSARVLVALNIIVARGIVATPPAERAEAIRRLLDHQSAHTTGGMRWITWKDIDGVESISWDQ